MNNDHILKNYQISKFYFKGYNIIEKNIERKLKNNKNKNIF